MENATTRTIPLHFNKSYVLLLLLGIGALFVKNPKFSGIAISDIAIVLGVGTLLTYQLRSIKQRDLLLLLVGMALLLYILSGIYKVPDTQLFIKYFTRLAKSALIAVLAYFYCNRLPQHKRYQALSFFFHLAVFSVVADSVYSMIYYYSSIDEGYGIWRLYSALKSSYMYSDKNMVAYTISILMVLSGRFFGKKYLTLLWVLTLLSLSRSGILVNSLLFFYFAGHKFFKPSYLLVLAGALLLSVALVFVLDLQSMFADRLSFTGDLSTSGRLGLQKMALAMWWDAPLTGKGLSGYEQYFMTYFEGGEINAYPHNLYVYVLAEFGLMGFGLVMCLFLLLTYFLYRSGFAAIALSYMLFGLFLFNFTEYQFFFIAGVLLAYHNDTQTTEDSLHPALLSQ